MGMEDGVDGENFTPGWFFFSDEAGRCTFYAAWRIRSYDSPDYPLVFFEGIEVWLCRRLDSGFFA